VSSKIPIENFTSERNLFTAGITDFQEDTLLVLETSEYVEIWYEKAHQVVARIDYISVVPKGRDAKEHDIQMLRDNIIDRIRKVVEYWVKMAQEPQQEIQEKWADCKKIWVKINREMKDIGLLEFSSPEEFVDLHDIVKQHVEQDSTWTAKIEKVENMVKGQV
jgi:phosphopantothenate synthetase